MSPRSDPGDSLAALSAQPGWEQLLAGESSDRAADLLAQADALRDGDDEARAIALRAYRALQAQIDPAEPAGCDRTEWVLDALRGVDHAFEPLLRRAGEGTARPPVRLRSLSALGSFRMRAQDLDAAEQLFLGVLAECRGTEARSERAVCLNLCRLYRRRWRSAEALVLGRRAVALFHEDGDQVRELVAVSELLYVLSELEAWGALDRLMPRARELMAALPDGAFHWLRRDVFVLEVVALHSRGRDAEALALLDELEGQEIVEPRHLSDQPWWRGTVRAALFLRFARLGEAAELLALSAPDVPPDRPFRFRHLQLEAVCAVRQGDTDRAEGKVAEFLALPHGAIAHHFGWTGELYLLVELARVLRDHGMVGPSRAAFDRAAACAVERIRETGRAVQDLPELANADRQDRELLARARQRFAREHRDLLDSLVELFDRAKLVGEPWLESLRTGDHALICAWCARARSADGTWIPVGHFFPQQGQLVVTHGMCEVCHHEHFPPRGTAK